MLKHLKIFLSLSMFMFLLLFTANTGWAQDSSNTNSNNNSNWNNNSKSSSDMSSDSTSSTSSHSTTTNSNMSSDSTNNMNSNTATTSFSEKAAKDLQVRLNLSEEQTQQVQNILRDYESTAQNSKPSSSDNTTMGTPSKAQAAVSDQIASVLDSNQKAQFDQVKDQWWASVTKDIGTTRQNQQNNGY